MIADGRAETRTDLTLVVLVHLEKNAYN